MSSPSTAPRPSVMQLNIKEKAALYAAYIPFFEEGGIFVPTAREYKLGDDVYVLLTLPDDPQRYPVAGRVAWVTPARAAGNRTQGVGIQFPKDEKSRQLKHKIEEVLGTLVHAFEQQQDQLFQSEALDVETDISVLETMMASDGLTEKSRGLHL